ncbi:Uncharacterized protein AXF42_Ash010146 [Apostasia shenzhenica]|uniref:At4g15545-like C-terminal domain-containing protein n=1 Tax=Apostasia shenzhenica TaxID=1088818 RepID=A0A2I0A9N3_9ASPA|nr:Uncharacterized protein AXF42_Ash010146 [Apostasia shenzhenica]
MAKNGSDFHLPDEILAVIPTDPYDQLDVARKITSMAIASRVTQLEEETDRLQQRIVEKDQVIAELQDRISELHQLYQESDSRLRLSLDENIRLAEERDTLALTVKKLGRDLVKLETFKRQLLRSLNDDNLSQSEEDLGASDLSIARIHSLKDHPSLSCTSSGPIIGSEKTEDLRDGETKATNSKFLITPCNNRHLTPNATPGILSTGGSPRTFSTANSSPKFSSSATSPTTSRLEEQGSLSSWYPSSNQSSASSSPPHGHQTLTVSVRAPRIDGKEFFRQARTRLSYEQFRAFLANIKELNAHRQSREETLSKAEEFFGAENKDLYISFQRLLNRNLH